MINQKSDQILYLTQIMCIGSISYDIKFSRKIYRKIKATLFILLITFSQSKEISFKGELKSNLTLPDKQKK